MDYKIELQSNNADLQGILDRVNALPEASGSSGGGVFGIIYSGAVDDRIYAGTFTQVQEG